MVIILGWWRSGREGGGGSSTTAASAPSASRGIEGGEGVPAGGKERVRVRELPPQIPSHSGDDDDTALSTGSHETKPSEGKNVK